MAEKVLVTSTLSKEMIDSGEILLRALDKESLNIQSFFWLFYPEEKTWKLIISSILVEQDGPREFYKRIMDINKQIEENIISLNDIVATDLRVDIVNLLSLLVETGDGISGIRCSGNTINGVYIEDSYIYRINIPKS